MNISTNLDKSVLPNDNTNYEVKRGISDTTKNTADIGTTFSMSDLWPFICDDNDTWCLFNDTSWISNSTAEVTTGLTTDMVTLNTTGDFHNSTEETDVLAANRYWLFALLFFPLLTVFGNVLVVMSVVRERQLKTATNYFICSLAVADIMVAVVVMPPAVYLEVLLLDLMFTPNLGKPRTNIIILLSDVFLLITLYYFEIMCPYFSFF